MLLSSLSLPRLLVGGVAVVAALCATGCSSSGDAANANTPTSKTFYPSTETPPPANTNAESAQPSGPRQGDGEQKSATRPPLHPQLKTFLQNHLFWTSGAGIRLEVPPQTAFDLTRYIWINPVNIHRGTRYGSDATLITDAMPEHYSPRDIEFLNDRNTHVVAPHGVHRENCGGVAINVDPDQFVMIGGVRIRTTPAFVVSRAGLEPWRKNCGYVVIVNLAPVPRYSETDDWSPKRSAEPTSERPNPRPTDPPLTRITIWYPGCIQATPDTDLGRPTTPIDWTRDLPNPVPVHGVDVLIVRINAPTMLSAADILNLARQTRAKVIVPVGMTVGNSADEAVLRELDASSSVPLWFPPLPPPRPTNTGSAPANTPVN